MEDMRKKLTAELEAARQDLSRALDRLDRLEAIVDGANPIAEVMEHFTRRWTRRHGSTSTPATPYVWNRRVDPAQIKRLLRQLSVDELKRRIDAYFDSRESFYQRSGHSFGVFVTSVNALAQTEQGSLALPPSSCRHHPPCRSDQQHTTRYLRETQLRETPVARE